MSLFGKKEKIKAYFFATTVSILMAFVSFGTTILRNKTDSNLCECISNDICYEINTKKIDRVEMTISHQNMNFSWFKNNDSAVEELSTMHNNDSVFMKYESLDFGRFNINENADLQIDLIGNANTRPSIIPYNISIIAGKYDYKDFNLNESRAVIDVEQPTLISESLANNLIVALNINSLNELIGYKLFDSVTNRKYVISCIAKDKTLFSQNESSLFMFCSFLSFSTIYLNETMVYRFSNDRFTNYTLLYYTLYYVFKTSTSKYLSLAFPYADWITNQFHIQFEKENNNLGLSVLCSFINFACSALLAVVFSNYQKRNGLIKNGCVFVFLCFLTLKIVLNNIFNCMKIGSINVNMFLGIGYFDLIIIMIIFAIIVMLLQRIIGHKNSPIILDDIYYELDI